MPTAIQPDEQQQQQLTARAAALFMAAGADPTKLARWIDLNAPCSGNTGPPGLRTEVDSCAEGAWGLSGSEDRRAAEQDHCRFGAGSKHNSHSGFIERCVDVMADGVR